MVFVPSLSRAHGVCAYPFEAPLAAL